jgi:excisionase family DNA binding protein
MSEPLLTAAEIADRLAVPKTWVLDSARSGAIPHLRLGRYVRFHWPDVEAWLAECRHPGRPIALRRGLAR